jgi:hypothetical protein
MAIILNTNNEEQNYYQRIVIENSFININGLYLFTHVYKTKAEREKEKLRQPFVNKFYSNYKNLIEGIDEIQNSLEKDFKIIEVNKVSRVFDAMQNFYYIGLNDNPELLLNSEDVEEAVKYGYDPEWCLNPIVLVRQDLFFVEEYNKQDFTLESFYNSLKNNTYTDPNTGKILYIDDL